MISHWSLYFSYQRFIYGLVRWQFTQSNVQKSIITTFPRRPASVRGSDPIQFVSPRSSGAGNGTSTAREISVGRTFSAGAGAGAGAGTGAGAGVLFSREDDRGTFTSGVFLSTGIDFFGMSFSSTPSSRADTSNRSRTQISTFLSSHEMTASPIRTNTIPRIRLNHHLSSAIPRKRAIIDLPPIAISVSMRASPSA